MIKVVNISIGRLSKIPKTAPVISITDRYSAPPVIPNEEGRTTLRLSFFPGDGMFQDGSPARPDDYMTKEKAESILEFMKGINDGDTVYVHCTEGRIRSYSVCMALHVTLRDVIHDREQACVKQGIEDRHTIREILKTIEIV